jgi:hypothetical protein
MLSIEETEFKVQRYERIIYKDLKGMCYTSKKQVKNRNNGYEEGKI